MQVIRLDEEAVLKTVGVDSLWGFESLCLRHRHLTRGVQTLLEYLDGWGCKS